MGARQRAKHSTKDLPIPITTFELGVIISVTDEEAGFWEVKASQVINHLFQRGTKWEFTFTL